MNVLYDKNSNIVELSALEDKIDADADPKVYINNATVKVTIKKNGTEISGASWPFTLTYVTGSDGVYRDVLSNAIVIADGEKLQAEFTVDVGGDVKKQGFFVLDLPVKDRKANLT